MDKELKGGIKIKFWTKVTENGLNMTRTDFSMPNINIKQVDLMLMEIDKRNVDPYLKKIEILERDERGMPTQYYTLSKIPMMTDREGLMNMRRVEKDGKIMYIFNSIERDDYPRGTKSIRIDFFQAVEYTP